jgi:hypothetical protein
MDDPCTSTPRCDKFAIERRATWWHPFRRPTLRGRPTSEGSNVAGRLHPDSLTIRGSASFGTQLALRGGKVERARSRGPRSGGSRRSSAVLPGRPDPIRAPGVSCRLEARAGGWAGDERKPSDPIRCIASRSLRGAHARAARAETAPTRARDAASRAARWIQLARSVNAVSPKIVVWSRVAVSKHRPVARGHRLVVARECLRR